MVLPIWEGIRAQAASNNKRVLIKKAAWLFLALFAVVMIPSLAQLFGMPFPNWATLRSFGGKQPPSRVEKLTSERDILAMDYVSSRNPPPGFEQWVKFAKQNQCHLGPYTRIDRDLEAFRDPRNPYRRSITRRQMQAAKDMPRVIVFTVKNGKVRYSTEGAVNFSSRFVRVMERFSRYLPDMEFVVNDLDEPRVLPGKEDDIDARLASTQCKNASVDFHKFRHLHGAINNRPTGAIYKPSKELLPIFSQTKINECYSDIIYPTLYSWDILLTPIQEREVPPWQERNATLFFRGATSGGHYRVETDFTISHRQRLVEFSKSKKNMDMAFSAFLQCEENVCKKMKAYYGQGDWVHQMDNLNYKYLVSIDGNTFVSRLPLFMSAAALIFRVGMFSEWYDEWIRPQEHYLHVSLDFSDMEAALNWALHHDDEARLMGLQARQFAKTRLRNQDMECYLYRLLLEYSAILQHDD